MPFKRDSALQNIPLSKQPFKTQPHIENEDITWSPQYNMLATRTNKRRALSLQEVVELDDCFLILHIVLKTCTIIIHAKVQYESVIHFYILGLPSWIWTHPSIEELKFESPSKWHSYEGLNLEHCTRPIAMRHLDWNILLFPSCLPSHEPWFLPPTDGLIDPSECRPREREREPNSVIYL